MDEEEILDNWNYQLSNHLIANNIILVLYMVIGLFGNILVIFIYIFKLKKKDDRYFIPVLATMDLTACSVGSSYALALNLLPAKFTSDILCKVLWYFSQATTISSGLLLVVIAVQRYLKVCKPMLSLTLRWKRIAIFLCFITSSIFSIPTLFFYGELQFQHPINSSVIGSRCGQIGRTDNFFRNSVISYTISEFLAAIAGCISFTVLYALIGKQIYKKFIVFRRTTTLRRRPIGKNNKPKSTSTTDDDKNRASVDSIDIIDIVSSINNSQESIVNDSQPSQRKKRRSLDVLQENVSALKQHFHTHRYTYMFMAITLFFMITFTPRITLMVLESVDHNFWRNLVDQPKTIAVCLFFYRFYIFNHIINPFIYGFFDTTFKYEVKKLFCLTTDSRARDSEF